MKKKPAKKKPLPPKTSRIEKELAALPADPPAAAEARPVAAPDAAPPTSKVRNRIKAHVTMRAGDLVPHELNFRRHPDAQKKALAGMYEEIGFARSLLAYELPDGRLKLVDGHLRQELDPNMTVTVEVLDLTDDEAKLMLAVTDPLAGMAEADPAALAALLAQIDTECDELAAMLAAMEKEHATAAEPTPGLTDPDAVPESPAEPVTRTGDVWCMGGDKGHRLGCLDSTDPANISLLMGDERAGLMAVDPPYGVAYENDERPNPGVAKPRVAKPRVANDGHGGERRTRWRGSASVSRIGVSRGSG